MHIPDDKLLWIAVGAAAAGVAIFVAGHQSRRIAAVLRVGRGTYYVRQRVMEWRRWRAVRGALRAGKGAESIFVYGLSRSGSTWLQEVIGAWPGTALLFEPIHNKIPETRAAYTLEDWWEDREGMSDVEREVVGKVLGGEILTKRVLGGIVGVPGEIRRFCVKLIHCNNGMPRMVHDLRPRYRPVLILRHPCAHVASWKRLKWAENFAGLSSRYQGLMSARPELRGVVEGLKTPLEQMAGSWCLGNWVPLTVEAGGRWTVVRYEELWGEPERVLGEIFGTWGEREVPAEVLGAVRKVSRTTWRKGQPAGAVATADSWREEISEEEARVVFEVCARFGVRVDYEGYGVG